MELPMILAAASGSITSALRFFRYSKLKALRTSLTGFCLAYFASIDLTDWINDFFELAISYEPIFFLLGYLGSSLLEQAIYVINAYTVKTKWK